MHTNHKTIIDDGAVVSKALLRAAKCLNITNTELAKITGISAPRLSKINHQKANINPKHKEFELALFFIRLFRSLDTITGGDNSVSALWIRNYNTAINDVPLERIKKVDGLIDVLSYLDSRRARI